MIDPKHECWWSRKQLTELRLSGNAFHSAGVSLRVLLSALMEPDLIWFSIRYGDDFEDAFKDNIMIVALDRTKAERFPQLLHTEPGPVAESVGDLQAITEYALGKEIAQQFGLSFGEASAPELPQAARYRFFVHDDCFAVVEPATDTILSRLVKHILKLHGFYLKQDADWSLVAGDVLKLLHRKGKISLRSKWVWWKKTNLVEIQVPRATWIPQQKIGYVRFENHSPTLQLLQS